jgi:hypothetical membrane protein
MVRTRNGDRKTAVARAFAIVAAFGPIAYVTLTVFLGLMWEGYSPIRDTQSELGAVDSPYRLAMNVAGFMGLGLCILSFAGAYWLLLRPSWAKTVAFVALIVAGAGMVVVGFFPCDAGCVDVTATSRYHSVFSMPAAIGLPLAAMLTSLAFRSDGRFGRGWQAASFWLGLLSLISGPLIALDTFEGAGGLVQRAAMWTPLAWMTAVSLRLLSIGGAPGRP